MTTHSAYPVVLGELETLQRVCEGASLARYGDGELALAFGRGIPSQVAETRLCGRLASILYASGECLVGIPNLHSPTPKAAYWSRYAWAASLLAPRPYVSAFITRPDSAPWIDTAAYWTALESLWLDQDVTLVRGGAKSLTAEDLVGARSVTEVLGPASHAFAAYDELLERIGRPSRALLCLGPTATVLAVDLAARGVHAVDLGHVGMFLKKHRRGEPLVVTAEDRAA